MPCCGNSVYVNPTDFLELLEEYMEKARMTKDKRVNLNDNFYLVNNTKKGTG